MNIQKVNVSGETAVTFAAFYPFIWIKNIGNADAYAANFSGFDAGDNDVACISAGEAVRLDAMSNVVYIKSSGTTVYAHAQNVVESPFLDNFVAGGEQIDVTALNVTENGTYTAPSGTAYSPVTVDVQEQPWEPLEDGYSNFWFELTNDTLSPWLNFSAKNADAVIDWGDGSGEVALDTLTPTHTYAKAGKYVVKVKGVTGIAQTFPQSVSSNYFKTLINVELNTEVTVISNSGFARCTRLENVVAWGQCDLNTSSYAYSACLKSVTNALVATGSGHFVYDFGLETVSLSSATTVIPASCFDSCLQLQEITIPASVTSIGSRAFAYCLSLPEIHMQATTPPTISDNAFLGTYANYIIYVPVGTGDTYKAAWSAYADHILEEGETPNI